MGNKSSLLLREEEIAQIQEETGCKCGINLSTLSNRKTFPFSNEHTQKRRLMSFLCHELDETSN